MTHPDVIVFRLTLVGLICGLTIGIFVTSVQRANESNRKFSDTLFGHNSPMRRLQIIKLRLWHDNIRFLVSIICLIVVICTLAIECLRYRGFFSNPTNYANIMSVVIGSICIFIGIICIGDYIGSFIVDIYFICRISP
jgi:hypothetical protein